jgi:hypothetical protein
MKKQRLVVYVNQKKMTLTESQYLTEGGEAQIYWVNDTIYKIYHSPNKMIPVAKIKELQELKHDNIIVPVDIIFDEKQQMLGITMNAVTGYELCRLFNTVYLNDNNITDDNLETLAQNMMNTIEFIHKKDCLIVDGNEMNYLIAEKNVTKPYFIDTNAYQTKSFKASAYSPMYTEPKIQKFDALSDWYSFAVLTCKLFVGMHPFKGHFPGYSNKDTLKRMEEHASIFNKNARLPNAARDFSHVPSEYFKWFVGVFEEGKRLPPPAIGGLFNVTQIKQQLTQEIGKFIIELFKKTTKDINRVYSYNTLVEIVDKDESQVVLFGSVTNKPYRLEAKKGYFEPVNGDKITIPDLWYEHFFVKDNNLYIVNNGMLIPFKLNELGDRATLSTDVTWNIPKLSSRVFDGVISAVMFGQNFLYIPVVKNNVNMCIIKHITEFDGHRVIYARCEKSVCLVITFENGKYHRWVIKFDKIFENYTIRAETDINYPYINFTVLDNGVCISMNENAEIEIFHADTNKTDVKKVISGDLDNKMILVNNGTQVMYYMKNKLFKISMKK